MNPTCAVCGSNQVWSTAYAADRFCSPGCEDWLIEEHRSSLLTDLATNMRSKGINMRGDQVLLWQ